MKEKYYTFVLKQYENKLKEYMTDDEYFEFATEVSKKGFKMEVESLEESEFKNMILENFNKIVE